MTKAYKGLVRLRRRNRQTRLKQEILSKAVVRFVRRDRFDLRKVLGSLKAGQVVCVVSTLSRMSGVSTRKYHPSKNRPFSKRMATDAALLEKSSDSLPFPPDQ